MNLRPLVPNGVAVLRSLLAHLLANYSIQDPIRPHGGTYSRLKTPDFRTESDHTIPDDTGPAAVLKLSPAQVAVKAPSGLRVSSISASPMQMTRGVTSLMREPYQEGFEIGGGL